MTDLGRDTPSVFGALTVPLLDPDDDVGNIGRLSLTLNAQAERPSDFSALTSWGATLNWGVTDNLSLLASFSNDEPAPSIPQLGAPPLRPEGVTYYDFRTGQPVLIDTNTGRHQFLAAQPRPDPQPGPNWDLPMVG